MNTTQGTQATQATQATHAGTAQDKADRQQAARRLVERFIAVWNESDPQARRRQIAELWLEDGEHYSPSMQARGYEALERRIIGSYDKWVGGAGHSFRARPDADGHHGAVKFHWEMVAPDGEVSSVGFEFLVLGPDGRIATDYMFVLR